MEQMTKVYIGLGVLVAGAGAIGLYEHYKSSAPAVLTGSPSITVTPGTMPNAILSLGAANANRAVGTYTASLPAGASYSTTGGGWSSSNPSVIQTPTASATSVTFTPMAIGQTTLSVAWVDQNGNAQNSSVLVTVQS